MNNKQKKNYKVFYKSIELNDWIYQLHGMCVANVHWPKQYYFQELKLLIFTDLIKAKTHNFTTLFH